MFRSIRWLSRYAAIAVVAMTASLLAVVPSAAQEQPARDQDSGLVDVVDPRPAVDGPDSADRTSPASAVEGDADESVTYEVSVTDQLRDVFGVPADTGKSVAREARVVAGVARLPDVPVSVSVDDAASRKVPGGVSARLLVGSVDEADAMGYPVVFDVDLVDASGAEAKVEATPVMELDVSQLTTGLQGNLSERLVGVYVDECRDVRVLVDKDTETYETARTCDVRRPVPTEFDPATGKLRITLAGDPAGGGSDVIESGSRSAGSSALGDGSGEGMYALASGPAGPSGDYSASPFAGVADYQVALATGAFETSHPIRVPPAFVGQAPEVGLVYSSASVDGMSSTTNNQASTVGLGWSLAAGGSIQRHSKTCGTPQAPGDLCPIGHEYSITLGGVSSRLVMQSASGGVVQFRLKADPRWKVEMRSNASSPSNRDKHGEYWVVWTPDGVEHRFGYTSDSADFVPFYTGAGFTDPFTCGTPGIGGLGQLCHKAWRWNLDRVVDTNGNVMSFSYFQEAAWYNARASTYADYVRASHLREISYSDPDGTAGAGVPRARVRFLTELRCGDPNVISKCNGPVNFVDTPLDLVCRENDAATCDQDAPTFFSERRLDAVVTQVLDGSWRTVDWWDLSYTFPAVTDSEPKLWLNTVQQRPGSDSTWPAYAQIEFEDYSAHSATGSLLARDYGEGSARGLPDDGSWLRFNRVDFGATGTASQVFVRLAANNVTGSIEVRLGSPTGTKIATVAVSGTGGLQTWQTRSATVSAVSGVHDVYFVAKHPAGGKLANINWFRFTPSGALPGLPYTNYDQANLRNRVETAASPMIMPRVNRIVNPLGGVVNVTYGQDRPWSTSLPASNPCSASWAGGDKRRPCDFFVAYDPNAGFGGWVHWNKWKVKEVVASDESFTENQARRWTYQYSDPTWRYSDTPGYNNHSASSCTNLPCNHWNDFRGHRTVTVRELGSAGATLSRTVHTFHQGMDKDFDTPGYSFTFSSSFTAPHESTPRVDHDWLAGRVAAEVLYAGDGASTEMSARVAEYHWATTAGSGLDTARFVAEDDVYEYTTGADPVRTVYTYDTSHHNLIWESHRGSTEISSDNFTIEYVYAKNTTKWILDTVARERTWPGIEPGTAGNELTYRLFRYDNSATIGDPPTKGNPTWQRVVFKRTPDVYADSTTTYDARGRVASSTDHNGNTTQYDYGSAPGYLASETNPAGHVTAYVTDGGTGSPTRITDPNNRATNYAYDAYGRLASVKLPNNTTSTPSTAYEYFPTQRPVKVTTTTLQQAGLTRVSAAYHDGFGRLIQRADNAEDLDGDTLTDVRLVSYQYGVLGEPIRESSSYLRSNANAGTGWEDPVWADVSVHTYLVYDAAHRVVRSETRQGPSVLWDVDTTYSGRNSTVTDPRGTDTVYRYDAYGNLTAVVEDFGTSTGTTTYTYDPLGRMESVQDPAGNLTTIEHDMAGRKTGMSDPDSGVWIYQYDDNGNLTQQRDGRERWLTFEYDSLNRPLRVFNGQTTGAVKAAQWTCDSAPTNGKGRLATSASYDTNGVQQVGVTMLGYDAVGRATAQQWETFGTAPGLHRVDWTYALSGQVTSMTYPQVGTTRETVSYELYTRSGLYKSATSSQTGAIVSNAQWTAHGAVKSQVWGSGAQAVTREWLYFEDSLRLAEILAGTAGGEGVEVARLRYHYDLGGNIIRMRDYRNSSQVQCFGYDTVNRLVSAFTSDADDGVAPCDDGYHATGVGPYSLLYTYNKIGNVTKVVDEVASQTVNYSYGASGAGPHAVTSAGGVSYGYDGNGNMVSRGGDALTFNQRNRLVAYQAGAGGETRFVYDADGNRLQRRAPDGSVLTSLDGVFERTVAGSTVTDRVWYTFGGQTVGSHTKTNTTGGQRAWIVTDHLNTHGIEVDAATGAVGRAFFDPFGAPRGVAGAGVTADVGYTGQRHDTTTGLMHYQSRYYDPALKRFISPDTIIPDPANPQDLNRYTYTRNNPTRYNDPTGHAVDSPNDCPRLWKGGRCQRPDVRTSGKSGDGKQPTAVTPGIHIAHLPEPTCDDCSFWEQVQSHIVRIDQLFDPTASDIISIVVEEDGSTWISRPAIGVIQPPGTLGLRRQPGAIGFAPGTASSALTDISRVQHATRHLEKAGILPTWSGKSSPAIIRKALTPILESPLATFDDTLRGNIRTRGFLGDINGRAVAVFVYKEGPHVGKIALLTYRPPSN